MKKSILFPLLLIAAFAVQAQPAKPGLTRAAAVKTLTVATESTVLGYEKVIAPGRLSMTKAFLKSDDGIAFKTSYTLRISADNSFNNRQPVPIGLSRKSFDSVFTRGSAEMAAKYVLLNRYVSENKLSLDSEPGWISVVSYFNSLPRDK